MLTSVNQTAATGAILTLQRIQVPSGKIFSIQIDTMYWMLVAVTGILLRAEGDRQRKGCGTARVPRLLVLSP